MAHAEWNEGQGNGGIGQNSSGVALEINSDESREELATMMRSKVWIAGLVAATMIAIVLLLLVGSPTVTASAQQAPAKTADVKIDNFSFGPVAFTVGVGTTVTWTNRDDIPHTVVSTDGVFKSKVLDTDEKFSYTFAKPGTFPYFCSIHPKMTGKVVVQ
jgi:plastocyanin